MNEPTGPKTHLGGCHCGVVRFRVTLDLSTGTGKCNCSICTKKNWWGASVKPEAFTLLSGADDVVDYQFNTKTQHHLFCKHCGIHTFGRGHVPQIGGDYVSINLNCLDEVPDPRTVPIRYFNGRANDWMAEAPPRP